MPDISLIVAMDENGLIGADGDLPWRLPNDLRHFKRTTMGKPILMGRRTFESIGKPLPGRESLILSRRGYRAEGCRTVASLDQALEAAGDSEELMVMGGAQVYAAALPLARRIYLTRIHDRFKGDTWFPDFDETDWDQLARQDHAADAENPHAHSFILLQRIKPHASED